MDALTRITSARTRSISPENFTGEKAKGGMATPAEAQASADKRRAAFGSAPGPHAAAELGRGWKLSPAVGIDAGETFTLADIEGPGSIQQIWMTAASGSGGGVTNGLSPCWRSCVLRVYWDNQEQPSIECPLGDFFAMGWCRYAPLASLAVCVNPGSAFNCYWEMPFQKRARVTLTNIADQGMVLYYQINYELREVPMNAGYFHAQFRRVNPVKYKEVYTIVDGVRGAGHYVGTYLAWGSNSDGWWGEGEIKFYMDGDRDWPTICGTGTEDYFCGSYNFENLETHRYQEYCTPYAGLHQVLRPDGLYRSQQRFGMYRWHIADPIRFAKDLRVTIQALGYPVHKGAEGQYLPLQDDIASVAYWYQQLPTAPFPALPERERLDIN